MLDLDGEVVFLSSDIAQFGRDLRIVGLANAATHQLDDVRTFTVQQRLAGSQTFQLLASASDRRFATIKPGLQEGSQMLCLEHALQDGGDHNVIQLLHRDTPTLAQACPAVGPLVTNVVRISAALAGPSRHAATAAVTAAAAHDMAGQQIGVRFFGALSHARITRRHLRSGCIEQVFVDDRRHRDRNPLILWSCFAGARVASIVHDDADISRVVQNEMDVGDVERLAAQPVAAVVKQGRQRRYTDRRAFVAVDVGGEHETHEMFADRIDLEFLAILAARLWDRHNAISERRRLAVPITPHSVCEHRALHMLGVLRAVIFIEQAEHADRQFACGIVAEGLGDRDDAHTVPPQHLLILHEV